MLTVLAGSWAETVREVQGARALLLAAGGVVNFSDRRGDASATRKPSAISCDELLREVAEKSCFEPPPFPKSRSLAENGSGNEPVSARSRIAPALLSSRVRRTDFPLKFNPVQSGRPISCRVQAGRTSESRLWERWWIHRSGCRRKVIPQPLYTFGECRP